ncbi:MAG: FtsW/RodA/SpoVE family cell cycle protein [Peptostreptococcaceae bacterium]
MPKEGLKKQIKRGIKTEFDPVVFYTTMTLVFIGIVMVFSASYIQAAFKHHDAFYFLKRNVIYAIIGFIGKMITSRIDNTFLKKHETKKGIIALEL